MKIVIPSYKRWDICITQNLFAWDCDIVIPQSQKEQYANVKANIITIPDELDWNISKKRNAILDLYKDEDIIMLDDDIVSFVQKDFKKVKPIELDKFMKLCTNAFINMERFWFHLWGVYPIDNGFFMTNSIATKGFIIWTVMLFKKWHWLRFDETLYGKEDYDISLEAYYKHWGVYRINHISFKKKDYIGMGGVAEQRTERPLDKQATDYLLKKRPKDLRKNPKRENEILIK